MFVGEGLTIDFVLVQRPLWTCISLTHFCRTSHIESEWRSDETVG